MSVSLYIEYFSFLFTIIAGPDYISAFPGKSERAAGEREGEKKRNLPFCDFFSPSIFNKTRLNAAQLA